jgi:hypothetical protein
MRLSWQGIPHFSHSERFVTKLTCHPVSDLPERTPRSPALSGGRMRLRREVLFPEETRPSRHGSFIQAKVFDGMGLDVLRCFFDGISQK